MDIMKYPEQLNDEEKILWLFTECAQNESPLKLTSIFCHKHYSIGMHTHNYFEVNFILNGTGIHYTEQGRTLVRAGDVFVIRPFDKHGYQEIENLDVFHLCIHKNFFNKYYSDLNLLPGFPLLFGIEPRLRKIINSYPYFHIDGEEYQEIHRLLHDLEVINLKEDAITYLNSYGLSLMVIATLCQLYHKTISDKMEQLVQDESSEDYHYERIFLTLDYIHKNYNKKIQLTELLKLSLLSKNIFYKEFKNCVNKTPREYIDYYRILQSKKLLMETDKTITEIAYRVGYCDESYFIKIYKKLEGISPSKFRQTLTNNEI